jgi:hypothetical protein
MLIYVWPNGNWIYEWETHGFTMEHMTTPEGGRWVNIDKLWDYPDLTVWEIEAVAGALGD